MNIRDNIIIKNSSNLLEPQQRVSNLRFSRDNWSDWQWHVRNRLTTVQDIEEFFPLTVEEKRAIQLVQGRLNFSLTPYWLSLMNAGDFFCPIRRQAIPLGEEFRAVPLDQGEFPINIQSVARGKLVHKNPDRAVLSVHSQCIVYCRFCPKSKVLPSALEGGAQFPTLSEGDWDEVLDYLQNHPQIQEIILSGGEPLLLNDEMLRLIFKRIKSVTSVRTLRIETRILSFLPQRVTPALVEILKSVQPAYLVLNVNHAREMTADFCAAAKLLTEAGVPLVSQTVLLRDINDKQHTLKDLFRTLDFNRILPYHLIQCSPSPGTDHFRTTLSYGLRLYESLRGKLPGLALPQYVVDSAGGKIPLMYESILFRNRKRVLLKNHEGKVFIYPEKVFSFSS